MIDDLRHYRAEDLGAFQFVSPGDAFVVLVCIIIGCLIFSPYIR